MSPPPLGLIAGNGRFPFLVAAAARRAGRRVIALAVKEEASPELAGSVDEMHWVGLGQLGHCIEVLKAGGVSEAVMAGQVQHRRIFSGIVPDLKLAAVLVRLAVKNTDSLIGGVADALWREGITLLPSTALLADQMATAGAMSRRKPGGDERKDIAYGVKVARALSALDLGQTVVKLAKPRQDMRFDVPVVGTRTLEAMREAGARTLAVEAGRTLLLDRAAVLAAADAAGTALWGIGPEAIGDE